MLFNVTGKFAIQYLDLDYTRRIVTKHKRIEGRIEANDETEARTKVESAIYFQFPGVWHIEIQTISITPMNPIPPDRARQRQ